MKRLLLVCTVLLLLPCVALAGILPDTGQTKCYDNTQEITCPNPGEPFYGQDAQYLCNPQSYTKLDENGNDLPDSAPWPWAMVRDNVTGLIWENKTDDGTVHDKDDTYIWQDAQDVFIATLNSQNFGGYSDWHLPTVKELSILVDSSIPYPGPTINSDYFPNTMSSSYWSHTTDVHYASHAWAVSFDYGKLGLWDKLEGNFVRAVRGEESTNNFIDNGNGTVTDNNTGLMWQKETAPGAYNWQQALSYCETLLLAGYDDWRLPNRNELQFLVDYDYGEPSIDPIFSNTISYFYWSSTTHAIIPSQAWNTEFYYGGVRTYGSKSDSFYVRAVRGGGALVDTDADSVSDENDNCPNHHNQNQADTYPPQGNSIGDACDCESDFNCDGSVVADDVAAFLEHFGRSSLTGHPCTSGDPCKGDFNCDTAVAADDVGKFLEDFGRTTFGDACPACNPAVPWCVYP